jgi:LysR family transcriptional regulator, nitrogen assimilation regulatory protein
MVLDKQKAFFCIVESESPSAVSIQLPLGTHALSRQIAALESEMRGRLLNRTGRGVKLKKRSERILVHADRVIEEVDSLKVEVDESCGVFQGNIDVAAAPAIAVQSCPDCHLGKAEIS